LCEHLNENPKIPEKSCRYKTEKVAIPPFLYYCEKISNQMTFCAYLDNNTVFDVELLGLLLTFQVKFSIRILHQKKIICTGYELFDMLFS